MSRPSPALLVALIALLAGLVTTASALEGRNTVDSGDIKAKAVKRSDHAVNQRTDWALIQFDGTEPRLIRKSQGVSLAEASNTNAYVDFGHSVANRPITTANVWPDDGPNAVGLCGEGAQGVECEISGTNNTRHVYVDGDPGSRIYLTVLPK